MELDCQTCGACCAFDERWPTLESERDFGPDGPPPELVADGVMKSIDHRCVALEGEIGVKVGCTIYERRPDTCDICQAGSFSCLMARKKHGLPVPEDEDTDKTWLAAWEKIDVSDE
ncbi:MAG: YkgJ family cysteine cluster protein [Verrucomicrobiota bacterium]